MRETLHVMRDTFHEQELHSVIVPMKKIHVVVLKKDVVSALKSLRATGTVHVEHQDPLTGYQLEERREEVEILENAINILSTVEPGKAVPVMEALDWTEIVNTVLERSAEVERYTESMAKRRILISQWEPWGDFNPQDIAELSARGIILRLCLVPKDKISNLPKGVILETVFSSGGIERCVAVSREEIDLPFETIPLPPMSLVRMQEQQEEDQKELDRAQSEINEHYAYFDSLQKILMERRDVLNFEEVQQGMREDGELVVLKGFCPEDLCAALAEKAKKERWGLLFEQPSDEDQVPTLLRNSKWAQLSKPALDMIDVLPGYKEKDVSAVFTIFFTLFFGMLIGDAAYGFIFACATFFVQKKLGDKVQDKTAFHLLYILTGFTMIWGILTGTYFGQQWLPSTINAVAPWFNDNANIQWFCFTIALVHLSIARLWTFKLKLPELTAFAEIGWMLIVWGMYFLANYFVLNKPFPAFAGWFFIIGIPVALIFMVPFKEFFKKVPQELIPFLLGVIGSGTDIISYIRLFAVGLATVAVADAANIMPKSLPYGMGYVFLVLLHVINMILAIMAILVHAIRLNLLEFSGHLGLQWTGFRYTPFKQLSKT